MIIFLGILCNILLKMPTPKDCKFLKIVCFFNHFLDHHFCKVNVNVLLLMFYWIWKKIGAYSWSLDRHGLLQINIQSIKFVVDVFVLVDHLNPKTPGFQYFFVFQLFFFGFF